MDKACGKSLCLAQGGKAAARPSISLLLGVSVALVLCLPLVSSQKLRISTARDDFVASGEALGGQDGHILLEVMLPFHSSFDHKTRICRGFDAARALIDVEAVRLAFELVEHSPLLGNISVGYDILDTCGNVDHVLEFAKHTERVLSPGSCSVNCAHFSPPSPRWKPTTAGGGGQGNNLKNAVHMSRGRNGFDAKLVIGLAESVVAQAIMPVLVDKQISLLSHLASSHRLTRLQKEKDKNFFYRVIPEDRFEVNGQMALLQHFQWTHIAAFSSRTPDNVAMLSILREKMRPESWNLKGTSNPPCLAIRGQFSKEDRQMMESAAKQLSSVPHINVVLILGHVNDTMTFLEIVDRHRGLLDRLVWLFSSKWGRELQQLPRGHTSLALLRRIKFGFFLEPVPASDTPKVGLKWDTIEEMLRKRLQKLSPDANDENFNPWFNKAWDICGRHSEVTQTSSSGKGPLEEEKSSPCTVHPYLGVSLMLMEACFQAAIAVDDLLNFKCDGQNLTNCRNVSLTKDLQESLRKNNLTGDDPRKVRYMIKFLKPQSQQSHDDAIEVVPLGEWSPTKGFSFREKTIQHRVGNIVNSVKSACPLGCKPGQKRSLDYVKYARRCCWTACHPCTGRTVSHLPDSEVCEECSRGQRPNGNHTACHLFKLTKTADLVSSAFVIAFCAVGSVLTVLTIILFHKHRDTFIVKTADITLSTVMLSFQLLSFLSVALLLVEPSKSFCISQVLLVLIWPVLYIGCILIKTNRLRVLFHQTRRLTKHRLLLLSNQTQVLIIGIVGILTGLFLIVWVVVSTPYRDIMYSPDSIDYTCHRSNTWMGVYFSGVLGLLVMSLVLSFQARNLPSDFNEASFLLLSTCSVTFLWIILIPAYYESTSIRRDTLLALIITGQGIVTLLCLFTRRLYYIVCPRSEEEIKSRRTLSKSASRIRMTVVNRASSASLRSHGSDPNHSSVVETQFGGTRVSEPVEESLVIRQPKELSSVSETGTLCATDEHEL